MSSVTNIYDYVVARLREKRIPQRRVANESGVAFSTVCKIAQGSIRDPSVHKVQRLYDYFMRLGLGGLRGADQQPPPAAIECASGDPRRGVERRRPEQRGRGERRKEAA